MEALREFVGRSKELNHIIQFLRQESHFFLMLTGDAGVGKTTFLLFVVQRVRADKLFKHVIFLSASRLNHSSDLLYELSKELFHPNETVAIKDSKSQIEKLITVLEKERVLIVLDGINELPSEKSHDIAKTISELFSEPAKRNSKLIISSRRVQNTDFLRQRLSGDYKELLLSEFTQAEAMALLDRLMEGNLKKVSSATQQVLFSKFGKNPFVLNLLARTIIERGGEINLDKLIEEGFKHSAMSLESVFDSYFADITEQEKVILYHLSMFDRIVTLEHLSYVSGVALPKLAKFMEGLSKKGLVIKTDDTISFVHVTLKEYAKAKLAPPKTQSKSGTLFITFDPEFIDKEDSVELLGTINDIFRALGGEEIIIREGEIGVFDHATGLVPA